MSKKASGNLIVGLDIGTSKVVAIVGEVTVEGDIEIIAALGFRLSRQRIHGPTDGPAHGDGGEHDAEGDADDRGNGGGSRKGGKIWHELLLELV